MVKDSTPKYLATTCRECGGEAVVMQAVGGFEIGYCTCQRTSITSGGFVSAWNRHTMAFAIEGNRVVETRESSDARAGSAKVKRLKS